MHSWHEYAQSDPVQLQKKIKKIFSFGYYLTEVENTAFFEHKQRNMWKFISTLKVLRRYASLRSYLLHALETWQKLLSLFQLLGRLFVTLIIAQRDPAMAEISVCPSVCLSVRHTLVSSQKLMNARSCGFQCRINQFFWDNIFSVLRVLDYVRASNAWV